MSLGESERFPAYGEVFPPRPAQPLPTTDARTYALRAFADFIATLNFRRAGATPGQAIEFSIARENIHIEQPDNMEDGVFPSIAFLPGRATYDYFGLGPPYMDEATFGVFAPGTVLITPGEYKESFTLEVWASKRAERRAVLAGLEAALLNEETSTATRIELPAYYGLVASFSLDQRELVDDDAARNRRRGHMMITLSVPIAQLVNANILRPFVQVATFDSVAASELETASIEAVPET